MFLVLSCFMMLKNQKQKRWPSSFWSCCLPSPPLGGAENYPRVGWREAASPKGDGSSNTTQRRMRPSSTAQQRKGKTLFHPTEVKEGSTTTYLFFVERTKFNLISFRSCWWCCFPMFRKKQEEIARGEE